MRGVDRAMEELLSKAAAATPTPVVEGVVSCCSVMSYTACVVERVVCKIRTNALGPGEGALMT